DDVVLVDDNAIETEISLGDGNDRIDVATVKTFIDEFGVEVVNTLQTTPGTSAKMTVRGGSGDDEFNVFHNEAELFLYGDDGDDAFALFSFLVQGGTGPGGAINLTTIDGGTGNNSYNYLQNAPVKIVGGAGIDTLTITGTGIKDVFVVTDKFVAGAG